MKCLYMLSMFILYFMHVCVVSLRRCYN